MAPTKPVAQPRRLRDYTVDDLKRIIADKVITIEQYNEGYQELQQENAALQAVVAQQQERLKQLELAGTDQDPGQEGTVPTDQPPPTPIGSSRASQRKAQAPVDDV